MTTNDISRTMIAEFDRKYLWWRPADGGSHSDDRIIGQTMNLGTYDDILLLEQTVGRARLVENIRHAEPGGISDRYLTFWRGWSFATGVSNPNKAQRRAFDAAIA